LHPNPQKLNGYKVLNFYDEFLSQKKRAPEVINIGNAIGG
jgi:hypothetical protein